jgi:hypothetical protein
MVRMHVSSEIVIVNFTLCGIGQAEAMFVEVILRRVLAKSSNRVG